MFPWQARYKNDDRNVIPRYLGLSGFAATAATADGDDHNNDAYWTAC